MNLAESGNGSLCFGFSQHEEKHESIVSNV